MKNTGVISQITISPLSFNWYIENFFERSPEEGTFYQSPNFVFGESTWCLLLYPNGDPRKGTVGNVELYLQKLNSFIKLHHVSFTMGIKYEDSTIYNFQDFTCCFKEEDRWGTVRIAKRSELSRYRLQLSPSNTLILFIKDIFEDFNQVVNLEACSSTGEMTGTKNIEEEGVDILVESLKNLLQNEEDYDVTFKVEDREFRAHRIILAARSPVFSSMFRHDMSEKNTGIVNIPDCGAEAFKDLLLYLYTGSVSFSSTDVTLDLYEASMKYDLEHLKRKCVQFMKEDMSVDSFSHIMAVSLKYNETELIKIATDFFTEHVKDILPTVKWQMFMKENHIAANELLIKAMENK